MTAQPRPAPAFAHVPPAAVVEVPADLAAAIAARYGATVPAGAVVRQMPRGASAFLPPVYDGKTRTLVYQDAQRDAWRHRGRPSTVSRDDIRRLHGQGMTDQQIADAIGCSFQTVFNARKAMGLPVNSAALQRQAADRDRLRELIALGHDDRDIAELLGGSVKAVRARADRMGLALRHHAAPARPTAPRAKGAPPAPAARAGLRGAALQDAVRADHAEGLTLAACAARRGVQAMTVWRLRRDMGLPATDADRAQAKANRSKGAARAQEARAEKAAARRAAAVAQVRAEARVMPARMGRKAKAEARRAAILAAHDRAETVEGIAAAMGLPRRSVAEAIRAEGRVPVYAQSVASAARLRDLVARVAAGQGAAAIAAAWGRTVSHVHEYAHRKGISLRQAGMVPANAGTVTPAVAARREVVARMRRAGARFEEMLAATGVSRATLSGDIKALGLAGTSPHTPAARSAAARNPALIGVVADAAAKGQGPSAIAAATGLPVWTVKRLLKKAMQKDLPL